MGIADHAARLSERVLDAAARSRIVDGLQNLITGIGTARDKTTYARYVDQPTLTVYDLETLWKDSALARKVVSKLPRDALREGFKVRRRTRRPEDTAEEAQLIADRCNELGVTKALYRGAWLGRLFGGAGIVMALRGAGRPETEVDPDDDATGVEFLRVSDRQDFQPAHWRPDGTTDVWWWQRVSQGGGPVGLNMLRVHDSRILWFGGAETTDRARARNGYWDMSVLQALFATLVSYDGYWASLDSQMADASQAVFHLQGFIQALTSNSGETGEALRKRLQLMDMGRSSSKALVLDAGDKDGNGREDYQVIERASLASMDKLTGVFLNRFATDADYPVSVLFEQAAAGTNATGESDLTLYYNKVSAYRKETLEGPATELVQLVAVDLGLENPEEWEIVWPELYVPKPLDVASAEKMRVDSAVGLVTAGVVLEEEVGLSLAEMAPGLHLRVDRAARETALKAGLKEVAERTVNEEPVTGVAPTDKASGRATKAKVNPAAAKNATDAKPKKKRAPRPKRH